jgi:hypothetical protein
VNTLASTKESFFELNAYFAQLVEEIFKVPSSVILGQAYLESNKGTSQLATHYNNLFGIKGEGDQGSVTLKSDEYINGVLVEDVPSDFARYSNTFESFKDYGEFLQRNPRYKNVFGLGDAYATIDAIAAAGYATDPKYSTKVKGIIDQFDLTQYDLANSPKIATDDLDALTKYLEDIASGKKTDNKTSADFGGDDDVTVLSEDQIKEFEAAAKEKRDKEHQLSLTGKIIRAVFVIVIVVILLFIIIQALPIPQVQAAKNLLKGATKGE